MNDRAPRVLCSAADSRHNPVRLLVLTGDSVLADAIARCCFALELSVQQVLDVEHAADLLAHGDAEMAVVDGQLGLDRLAHFLRELRIGRCADWVPVLVAGDVERLRPWLRQETPGMVDHVIARPLRHDDLHDALVAARRTVSLHRAFDSTLDRVSEAVIVIDESGRTRSFNAAAERLFQWRSSEILGTNVSRLMPDRQRREHDGHIARYQCTGQAHVIGTGRIETGQRRDGSQFPMHLTVSDISDSYGTRFVGVIRDLTLAREAETMRQRALHDTLTGLPNHANAQEQLRAACEAANAGGERFAVLYLDLDRFKPVNDTHGHAVGDQVLQAVAGRLRHGLSERDLVARMGGDEFMVLLRGIERSAQVESVARRLQDAVTRPVVVGEHRLLVGLSAGAAVHGIDGTTPESLLHAADTAMYAAKRVASDRPGLHGAGQAGR